MKKWFIVWGLCLCIVMSGAACAQSQALPITLQISLAQTLPQMEFVFETLREPSDLEDTTLHRLTYRSLDPDHPLGGTLEFATETELMSAVGQQSPFADINFDGYQDFVPCYAEGAANMFYSAYLWSVEENQFAPLSMADPWSFSNYTLFPESGLIETYGHITYEEFTVEMNQIVGNELIPVRGGSVQAEAPDYETIYASCWEMRSGEKVEVFREVYPSDADEEASRKLVEEIYMFVEEIVTDRG